MDLFLIHCVILVWVSLLAAQRLAHASTDRWLAAGLLAWGNLVATSLVLSLFHLLGDRGWFLGGSVGLAVLTGLLLQKLLPEPAPDAEAATNRLNPWLLGAFVLTLGPAVLASVVVAFHYAPNQNDALTFQLPRVMYYLGQGSLGHFAAADARQLSLPFNYNLIQLLGLIYSPPLMVLNFFNLAAWALSGVAAYRLCRAWAFSANASLVATWFLLVLPPLLAGAASTTPDLAVGAGLGALLLFARRWRQTGQPRYVLLASLAGGVAAGSDLRALALVFVGGLLAMVGHWRAAPESGRPVLRAWLVPGILAGMIGLSFALINFAERASTTASLHGTAEGMLVKLQRWFLGSDPSSEDGTGFGVAGGLFLFAALVTLARNRRPAGAAGWALGWIAAVFLLPAWSPASPRDLVPAFLLLTPSVARLIDFLKLRSGSVRLAGWAMLLFTALMAGRSSGRYLSHNDTRPFAPLLHGTTPPLALPLPPLLVEYHFLRETEINVQTDGSDEPIFPFMGLRPNQRFTSQRELAPGAYNLISRSSQSYNLSYDKLAGRSAHVMVPVAGKATAGVEFLGTVGHDSDARDYFGLAANANQTPSLPSDCALLVTISADPAAGSRPAQTRIRLAGLNAADHAHLQVSLKLADTSLAPLTTLKADGEVSVASTRPFAWLIFQVLDNETGRELGSSALAYAAPIQKVLPIDPSQPSGPGSVFVTDLVLARETRIATEGLAPVEGPFPQWDLPHIRWARASVVRVRIPPTPPASRLQLSFSVRTHVRPKAVLEVLLNGSLIQRFQLNGRTTWLEPTLDLVPGPGENVLEFRDASGAGEPDWLDYLARYPDVKADLVARHLPLESGAREHFDLFGRSEGRTVQMAGQPEEVADSFYFLFRHLRLEGFNQP